MSVDNEQQFAMDPPVETNDGSAKKPRISYTREFLLSLCNLDVCKKLPKLPSGSEELLSCYSEDPLPERRRTGDFLSHGFKRDDYSSSPPTRGESGSYSRGPNGRWEGRSGGWNDKDSDSQSDRDSEHGRRFGMPSRRPWQAPEHDGLLGKGSFPRPSGYGAGTSGPRSQSNDSYQLSRSSEPYHPPRPYKASPYSRRGTKDSLNDETFSSSDSTSENRAEEERKRRASFELLRKEQHKAFQERQKLNPEGRKNDFDFTELLGDSKDEQGQPDRRNQVSESSTLLGSNNSAAPSQNTTPRLLVPPGFASTLLERKQGAKPPTGVSQHEGSLLNSKDAHLVNKLSVNDETQLTNQAGSNELFMRSTDVNISANLSEKAISLSTVHRITTDTGYSEKNEEATTKLDQKKNLGNSDGSSILDKIFNTALNLNVGDDPTFIDQSVSKVEERLSPQKIKSSKFAYLFLEEDSKPREDLPSIEQPSGLLSLLQGANSSQTFDVKSKGEFSPRLPFQGRDTKKPDQLSNNSPSKAAAVPPILTCEDLEQSILSEVGDSNLHSPPSVQDSNVSSMRTKQHKTYVDDQASQHLLSLLQRGPGLENQVMLLSSNIESRSHSKEPLNIGRASREADAGSSQDTGKNLTLETLFGSSFMKELQSSGEPVSAKAGVSEAHGLPMKGEGLLLAGPPLGLDQSVSELSHRDHMRSNIPPGGLFCTADNSTGLGPNIGAAGVGVPGEDKLLTVGDSAKVHKCMPFKGIPNQELEMPFNIAEKLAALNSGLGNERPLIGGQDSSFLPYPPQYANGQDLPFQPSSAQPSHPQLQPSHLNGSGHLFHSFDPRHGNVKSQIDLMASGSVHQDPPLNHQFPANMIRTPFHHTPGGVSEFDHLPHPIFQQMHMRGNMPHTHLLQGFPGGPPHHHPPGVNNQMPELNPSQGFPFAHHQPNFAGHNMPPPVPEVNRSDHPGSLHRILGMDQRMESQPILPKGQAGVPHRQGSLGHDHDLGFSYR